MQVGTKSNLEDGINNKHVGVPCVGDSSSRAEHEAEAGGEWGFGVVVNWVDFDQGLGRERAAR